MQEFTPQLSQHHPFGLAAHETVAAAHHQRLTITTITIIITITTIIIITRVTGVRDLTTGHDSTQPDNKAVLPVSASSQMVGDKIVIHE